MAAGSLVLTVLRCLVLVFALGVVGLGAYIQHTVHDVEIRGNLILDIVRLPIQREAQWKAFFDVVLDSNMRIWVAIAAGCFTTLAGLLIILSAKVDRLRMSRYVVVPLELLVMLVMAGAFAAILSLAIKFGPACAVLDPSSSPDLASFETLCPISKAYSGAAGAGWFVAAITSLAALIDLYQHARSQSSCSFEPTASALGMSHGYQAVTPAAPRATIPTIYDPKKPMPGTPPRPLREDELGLADAGAAMGVREPSLSEDGDRARIDEKDSGISGPLGLEKPETARQMMRPARPWSEMPSRSA
ncbi:hypothetical protein BDV96DRAFT_646430 [Lophiotrema nucula]|uniref:Uncharacterized protein n=1 Tax=Lophiotrema nucula TaxID=690887 RepID=A0A6A5Z929_9PLEO|nr:hypothetical protein BDV96DRAFT_646430 [Lophiotrema nucula]